MDLVYKITNEQYYSNLKNILSSHHRDVTDDVTTALNMEAARKRGIVEYDFPYLKGKKQVKEFIDKAKEIVADPEEYLASTKRNDHSVLQHITPKKIVISGASLTTIGLITGSILDKSVRQNTVDGFLGASAFTFYNVFIDNILHVAVLFPVGIIFGTLAALTVTPFRNTKKEQIDINEELEANIENDNVIKLSKTEQEKLIALKTKSYEKYPKLGEKESYPKERKAYIEQVNKALTFINGGEFIAIINKRQKTRQINFAREKLVFQLVLLKQLMTERKITKDELDEEMRGNFSKALQNAAYLLLEKDKSMYHDQGLSKMQPRIENYEYHEKFIKTFNKDGKLAGEAEVEIKQIGYFYKAEKGCVSKTSKLFGGNFQSHSHDIQWFITAALVYASLKLIGVIFNIGFINDNLELFESVPERVLSVFQLDGIYNDLGEGSTTAEISQDVFESYNVIENAVHIPLLIFFAKKELEKPGYMKEFAVKTSNKVRYLSSVENKYLILSQ